MMHTAPVLLLNESQVAQLIGHCTAYRSYLWQSVMPTPERNQTIRSIQALQGSLEKAQEQGQSGITLFLNEENAKTLRYLLKELLSLYATMRPSEQRTRQLAEIAGLRLIIERALRQTQEL